MLKNIRRDLSDLKIKYIDNSYIFIPPVLLAVIEITVLFVWGFQVALLTALPLTLLVLIALVFHLYRKVEIDLEEERTQHQALLSIHHCLSLRSPLPPMARWAAYPELGNTIIEYAKLIEPKFILEAGSGVSSLISCYCLEQFSKGGEMLSLDHDEFYGEKTNDQLKKHGLSEIGKVVHAPLTDHQLDGKTWQWYTLDKFTDTKKIDLMIIDGPPVKTQSEARYPALPLLFENLSEKAVIILDDAGRDSEMEVVKKWLAKYPELSLDYRPSKKGIAILTRGL